MQYNLKILLFSREKMEDLEDKITEEQQRKKAAEEKLQAQNKLLIGIREGLDHITEKLFLGEIMGVPPTRNSVELLSVCTDKMSRLMTRLSGINIYMKKLEMEEEQFIPVGLELPKVRNIIYCQTKLFQDRNFTFFSIMT